MNFELSKSPTQKYSKLHIQSHVRYYVARTQERRACSSYEMGAGSSASKTRVLAKVQAVAALSARSDERNEHCQEESGQGWRQADRFITK